MVEYCCDEFKDQCGAFDSTIEYRNVFYHEQGYVFVYEGQTISPILKYCPFCGKALGTETSK
jgi:hypothetical protein